MAYLIERSNAFEAAFESNAGNGKVGILKHRKRLMYAVKVKHFFEVHVHISVEGAREILIIISLFLRDIFKRNVVFEVFRNVKSDIHCRNIGFWGCDERCRGKKVACKHI